MRATSAPMVAISSSIRAALSQLSFSCFAAPTALLIATRDGGSFLSSSVRRARRVPSFASILVRHASRATQNSSTLLALREVFARRNAMSRIGLGSPAVCASLSRPVAFSNPRVCRHSSIFDAICCTASYRPSTSVTLSRTDPSFCVLQVGQRVLSVHPSSKDRHEPSEDADAITHCQFGATRCLGSLPWL